MTKVHAVRDGWCSRWAGSETLDRFSSPPVLSGTSIVAYRLSRYGMDDREHLSVQVGRCALSMCSEVSALSGIKRQICGRIHLLMRG